jgi:hypothetical protein
VTAPAVVRRWQADLVPGTVLRHAVVRFRRVAPVGAALLTVLIAHVGVAPHLSVGGAKPDVLLIAVVAVAAGRGPRAGAGVGFAAGLGADLFLATPLGTAALAFTVVGHVLGTASRPRLSSGTAAALCSPASTCFSCRTGGRHRPGAMEDPTAGPSDVAGRPTRARRQAAVRRAATRRSIILTMLGVGAGQLATTAVATALGGVPFPGTPHLIRIAAAAALSAPLGPLAAAVVHRS